MVYIYTEKSTVCDLNQIHLDVLASAMTDKGIEGCKWDEDTSELKVVFTAELSTEDKSILDTVVTNNS